VTDIDARSAAAQAATNPAEKQGDPGYYGSPLQQKARAAMLRRSIGSRCTQPSDKPNMTNLILALVPLAFATGSLVWLMTSGAQSQARSDAYAEQWMRDNA
jgi:hypothetical protein